MNLLPETLRFEIQAYMKPSEILSEYSLELQLVYLSKNQEAWTFWIKQAHITFGISTLEFKNTLLDPYERYLQLYMAIGEIDTASGKRMLSDYGSERYKKLGFCAYDAVKEGNIFLLEYFFGKSRELKLDGFANVGFLLEYTDYTITELFTNFNRLGEAAGEAPNFLEILDFLMKRGLTERRVEVAWTVHFLKNGDYKRAASLIRNDKSVEEEEYPLVGYAFDYAFDRRNIPLMKKLHEDFKPKNIGDYIRSSNIRNDPELLQLSLELFYPDDFEAVTGAYEDAVKCGANNVISWLEEKYPQLFGRM